MILRPLTFALAACLSLACSSRMQPSAPARLVRVDPQPAVTLAANAERPSRREVIRGVIPHNVRVFVYEGNKARRTASGVVLAVTQEGKAPRAYVITNAHVVDPKGLNAPRYAVVVDRRAESTEFDAKLAATGAVPDMDLGLLTVDGLSLPSAELAAADELELGEEVMVAAAPYGRPISLSGGIVSHLDWDKQTAQPKILKTDAAIGYGASGGGIYSLTTGRLLAIVEGYRTAKVSFAVSQENFSFDVPMPGETFAAPTPKIRAFLDRHGFGWILDARPTEKVAAITR